MNAVRQVMGLNFYAIPRPGERRVAPRADDRSVPPDQARDDIREGRTRNELRLQFQPKVNVLTGGVSGVEALVRWQHPERGLLERYAVPAQQLRVEITETT